MAQFRVGQRAKVVYQSEYSITRWGHITGKEGTVVDVCDSGRHVGAWRQDGDDGVWMVEFWSDLAPITDQKADQFIESLKKLGWEPITEAPNVHRSRVENA